MVFVDLRRLCEVRKDDPGDQGGGESSDEIKDIREVLDFEGCVY